MQKTEIIRAYLLEKGDRFIIQGTEYLVQVNNGEVIKYGIYFKHCYGISDIYEMGANSRQLVKWIVDPVNLPTHSVTPIYV